MSYSAVYVLLGVGLIPLSILAVRIAQSLIHPTVFTTSGAAMTGDMFMTFLVALAGMLCLGRRDDRDGAARQARRPARARAAPPARGDRPVSLRTAIDYVAAVYLLVWVAIFVYMALIGQKVTRIEARPRADRARARRPRGGRAATPAADPVEEHPR